MKQEKLDNKLNLAIEEKKQLEERIRQSEKEIKTIKENMIMNSEFDLKVEFEEDSGVEYYKSLDYNVYILRNNIKELILEEIYCNCLIEIDVTNKYDYIIRKLNKNNTLIAEEVNKILGECLKFRDTVIARKKSHYEEWRNAKDRSRNGNVDLQVCDKVKDLRKEMILNGYKVLAKKYHPDMKNGDANMFRELSEFKDKLLDAYKLK